MGHKLTLPDIASRVRRHVRTVELWAGQGFFPIYRDPATKRYLVDLDEFEEALATNPRMRDGRKPFGEGAIVRALPVQAEPDPNAPARRIRVEAEPEVEA